MKTFQIWLEYRERTQGFYRNLILGKLGLDRKNGLDVRIDSMERENVMKSLRSLGEFADLNDAVRSRVQSMVKAGSGTVGDLVRVMAGGAQ